MKIIGIVMRIERFDSMFKWFVNESYVNAIVNLGAAVFPICSYTSLEKAKKICNGLIIPGGYDVQSYYVKQLRNPHVQTYERAMDHFDFACIDAFYTAHKPILGICRGMQMINVYLKGNLIQHIEEDTHAKQHEHLLHICEDSFLSTMYAEDILVNSYHHQVIATLASQLKVAAVSNEGFVEAFEDNEHLVYGVQWHPEKMENDQILPYFLDVVCK
ncbi:MAG: type 1 glutamine amidotransferase [Longicatena sp.]